MKKERPGLLIRFLGYVLLLINTGAVVWLALCYAASVTSPERFQYLALFSLTTPIAIIVNLVFVFFWLFTRKRLYALLSLIALATSYQLIIAVFAFNFFVKSDMSKRQGTIKIMTWNVHGMGIFKVPHDKEFDKQLVEYIRDKNADIICLPEFSTSKNNLMKPFAEKILANGYVDYRFKDDNTLGKRTILGTAVFSKYPFQNSISHKLAAGVNMIQGDMELPGGQTIRMFFIHLNTFGLSDNDKAYIEEIKNTNLSDNSLGHSSSFIWKFDYAFKRRAVLADQALNIINQSPYPVFICGDLNDLPASYTYKQFRGDHEDAFLNIGKGFGRTYNGISPTLRIDHIFYDPSVLKLVGIDCPFTMLSDHNPVIANFEIIPKAKN